MWKWFAKWLARLFVKLLPREHLKLKGVVEVIVKDAEGNVLRREVGYNAIVLQGKQYLIANILNETTRYNGAYLAISSNNTTPSDNETSVPNLISAKTATKSKQISTTPYYAQWSATWGTNEANGTTIASVAICENQDGSGEWSRYVLSQAINKTSEIQVEVNYQYQL